MTGVRVTLPLVVSAVSSNLPVPDVLSGAVLRDATGTTRFPGGGDECL
jgi:hypothetical protein